MAKTNIETENGKTKTVVKNNNTSSGPTGINTNTSNLAGVNYQTNPKVNYSSGSTGINTNTSNLAGVNYNTKANSAKPVQSDFTSTYRPAQASSGGTVRTANSAIQQITANKAEKQRQNEIAKKYDVYDFNYSENTNKLHNDYLNKVNNLYNDSQDPRYEMLTSDPLYKDYMSDDDRRYLDAKNNQLSEKAFEATVAKGDYGNAKELEDKSLGGKIKDEDVFTKNENGEVDFVDFSAQEKNAEAAVESLRKALFNDPDNPSLQEQLAKAEEELNDIKAKKDYQSARYDSLVYEYMKNFGTRDDVYQLARLRGSYGNTALEDIGLGLEASKFRRIAGLTSMYEAAANDIDYSQIEEYQEAINLKNQMYDLAEDPMYNLLMEQGYENLTDEQKQYVDSINKQIKDLGVQSKELTRLADEKYASMDKRELGVQLNNIANELSFMQNNGEDQTKRLVVNTIVNVIDNMALQGGGIALAGNAGMQAGTAYMSAGAFAETYAKDLENGFSPRASAAHALMMYGLEYGTELISGDNMVKLFQASEHLPTTFSAFVWENMKQGGAEATEEFVNWLMSPAIEVAWQKLFTGDVGSIEGYDPEELKESLTVAFTSGMLQGSFVQTQSVFDNYAHVTTQEGKNNLVDVLMQVQRMEATASTEPIVMEDGTVTSEKEILQEMIASIYNGINNYYEMSLLGDAVEVPQSNNLEGYVEELTPKADEVNQVERDQYIGALESEASAIEQQMNTVDGAQARLEQMAEEQRNAPSDVLAQNETRENLARISKTVKNAINPDGTIKRVEQQINEMAADPGSFGLGVLSTNGAFDFSGIGNEVYFTPGAVKKALTQIDDNTLARVLNNAPSKTFLGSLFNDGTNLTRELYVENDGKVYVLHLNRNEFSRSYEIDEIKQIRKLDSLIKYLNNALKKGDKFFLNKKSNQTLRYLTSNEALVKSVTSNSILPSDVEVVKRRPADWASANGTKDIENGIKPLLLFDDTDLEYVNAALRENGYSEIEDLDALRNIASQLESDIKHHFGEEGKLEPFYDINRLAEKIIKDLNNRKVASLEQENDTIENRIYNSMSMQQADRMVNKVYNATLKDWYDNAPFESFVEEVGPEEASRLLAEQIENGADGDYYFEYVGPYVGFENEDFNIQDIIDAYFNNNLKQDYSSRREMNEVSYGKGSELEQTFYSPKEIEDGRATWELASQRITNQNRDEVIQARADAVIFAHTNGASEALGISQAEINKKIKQWSNYSSKARDISNRWNEGVPREYQWVGLENSNILSRSRITTEQISEMVKDVYGFSELYEPKEIADAMLAFDGSINYKELIIEYLTWQGARELRETKHALGTYDHWETKIDIGSGGAGTVYHELGHFIDNLWGREISNHTEGHQNNMYLSEAVFQLKNFKDLNIEDENVRTFVGNYRAFIENLTDKSDIRSDYTQDKKEVFARFCDYFVHWVDKTAGGWGADFDSPYQDNFNTADCYDFVKLLQQKNMLNATLLNNEAKGAMWTEMSMDRFTNQLDETQNGVPGEEFVQQNPQEYYEYGMNPVRDTDILRKTEEGPTRRHVNNMTNSAWVSDEEAQRLQQTVEDGDYAYQPVVFEEVDNQAKEALKKKGLQESYKEVIDTKDITLEKIALARQVLNQLRIDGKEGTPEYEKLQRVNARFYTPSAQMLAYARWLRQSTPDGQIITIESEIERMQEELQNRWGDRAPKLEIPEDLRSEYVNPNTKEERRQEIREEIAQQIADQIPPSVLEQLNSFRHLAMLFNPKTWIKNNLSNMAFGYVNEATRAMRSVLETIAKNYGDKHQNSIFAGMEREAGSYNPLSKKDTTLYKKFEQDYLNNYKNNISKYSNMDIGEMLASSEFGDLVQGKRKQFTSDFLNALSEINAGESKNRIFKYFGLSDTPAMKKAYAKSMVGYFKAKNLDINNVTEEQMQKAREFAYKEALYATFNTNNWLANQITKFERNADKAGHGAVARMVVESFIPFKRTPLNLIKTGYNYTPLGLATNLARDLTMAKKGQMTANQLINHMAQGLTGSSLFALGMLMANLGLFRTKDEDKDRKKYFDQENGEQDYALVFDGGTYTIDWLDPMIVPIAMGAEAFKAFGENDGLSLENLINIAASVADPMFETSMLSGISKNLSGFETNSTQWWGQIAKNAITTYASQYVPSMLGATARTVDDTRRSSYTDKKGLEKFARQTLNKIPFASRKSEPYINKQGEEEKNEDLGMGVAGRAILNFLSPGYYSSKDIDQYDEELYRLYDAEGDIGVLPSSTSKSLTYDKQDFKFTAKEYTEWHKTRYKTESEYVDQFIDSDAYRNLSDQERIDTIKDIRSYAQKVAKKQFLESKGYTYTDDKELAEKEPTKYVYDKELANTKTVMDSGVELYQYYDYLNNAGTKQAEKLKYLEESGFSEKQKKALYDLSGYKTSYEDAYAKAMGEKTSTKKNSSSKKKTSSSSSKKSSSKVSTSKVSSAPKAKKGSVSMNKVSSAPNTKIDTQKLANNYLKAYSNTMSKSKASQTGSSVVCPRCRNRVTPYNGKCPVCGNNL